MAAVVHSTIETNDSSISHCSMTPVPEESREFLYRIYGIEPHEMAYFSQQGPNRVYGMAHGGELYCMDMSATNPKSPKTIEKPGVTLSGGSRKSSKFNWQTLTDVEREQLKKQRHKENTYKTSLCRKFRETGKCERGEACIFAHGEEELRRPPRVHPKYKTQLCNNFIKWNYCPYGSRCQFIHDHAGESMQFTNWRTTGDLESVHNNFSHMESFNMKQKDTSIRCMSSSVTPAELFAEQSGFCHSYANPVFNRAGNMGYFAETINNQSTTNIVCGNQSHSHARPFASNGILDQLNSIDSDSVLEQLSEQFNNMLI